MFLLQGIPGLPELLVVLLILAILSLPVLLAIGAGAVYFLFVREGGEENEARDRATDAAVGTPGGTTRWDGSADEVDQESESEDGSVEERTR